MDQPSQSGDKSPHSKMSPEGRSMSASTAPAPNELPVTRRPGWIGPLRLPELVGRHLLAAATRLSEWLGAWHWWLLAAALVGTLPLLVDYGLGSATNALVTGLLVAPLLLAAVAGKQPGKGMAVLVVAIGCHSVLAIFLAAYAPDRLAAALPQGPGYWQCSRDWITTGVSPEYDVSWWLPAHVQLFVVMVALTYTSLGLIPLWQGLREVDLMNFYVGQLVAHSQSPAMALAVGWHPWSLCRGAGYVLLTFEVTSLSLSRLAGVPLSSRRARWWRWGLGLGFLTLDAVIKYTCLEPVRQFLAATLR
jgi:hypothetical protein